MVKSACGIEAVYMCFNGTGIWGGETIIQALPAGSARGRRYHQDRPSTQTDWRPRGLGRGGLRAAKCMLNPCSDYDDA